MEITTYEQALEYLQNGWAEHREYMWYLHRDGETRTAMGYEVWCLEGARFAQEHIAAENEACAQLVGELHVLSSKYIHMSNTCNCEQIAAAIRARVGEAGSV